MNRKLAFWFLISCQGSAAPFALAQDNINQELNYYCNAPKLEYQQSVSVGEARTLILKSGSFNQLEKPSNYQATVDYISDGLKQIGYSDECAEFLLSKSTVKMTKDDSDVYARVYFDFNKHALTSNSRYVLRNVSQQLKAKPTDLIVEGHADSIGSHGYNFTLGLKRSKSVMKYLVDKGVDPADLVAVSKGEIQPIASNKTAQGRQKNRRVDLLAEEPEK